MQFCRISAWLLIRFYIIAWQSSSITMASWQRQESSWIQSFLADRNQQVVLDGKKSSPAAVTSGVPHGTVLWPLLFLVYINDLPSRDSSSVGLFADDCLLYSYSRPEGCMQSHYKQILIICRNGKETGRWYSTKASANISGSPTTHLFGRCRCKKTILRHAHNLLKYISVTKSNPIMPPKLIEYKNTNARYNAAMTIVLVVLSANLVHRITKRRL